jgi:hypothetical protein
VVTDYLQGLSFLVFSFLSANKRYIWIEGSGNLNSCLVCACWCPCVPVDIILHVDISISDQIG